jgi:chromosome segregation ATPase
MNEYIDKIKQSKEEILKERLAFQKEKEAWENSFNEEKSRLEKEIELFQKFKKMKEEEDIHSREQQKLEEMKDEYDCKDIQNEIENIKSQYEAKLEQIENKKKVLEDEKEVFEKYKTDMNNSMRSIKLDIEQKKIDLLKQNSEINKRYNDLRNKEVYINDKWNDYQKIKSIVETKEKQNFEYEKSLNLAASRMMKCLEEIKNQENLIEQKKTDYLKKMCEVKELQKKLEKDKMDIEQQKAEINLRYQNLITFTYKNPNVFYEKPPISQTENLNLKNIDNNQDLKNTNYRGFNTHNFNSFEKFNANKYLQSVKERIENGQKQYYPNDSYNNSKLNIGEERSYILKNNQKYDKNYNKY